MATVSKKIRLGTEGAEHVARDFNKVGAAGEKMGRDITKGAKGLSPALRGVDTAAAQAKSGVEGLAGRAGALGGVLSSMGPLGLAAAAGIGALGAAFATAVQQGSLAVDWAEKVDLLSQRLGIGTTAIQEWRDAAAGFGVDNEKADASLDSLNKNIGTAILGTGKAAKIFALMGFTPEQIKSFRDVDSALPLIADKLKELPLASRQAFADKLGIGDLLPLLSQGSDGIASIRDRLKELGPIVAAGDFEKLAAANDKMDDAAIRAERATRNLSIALAPLAGNFKSARTGMIEFFADVIEGFKAVEDRSEFALRKQLKYAEAMAKSGSAGLAAGQAKEAERIRGILRDMARAEADQTNRLKAQSATNAPLDPALAKALEDIETTNGGTPGTPPTTPTFKPVNSRLVALQAEIDAMRKARDESMRLAAIEAANPGLTREEIKAKDDLFQAMKRIDEARVAGVKLTAEDAQSLKDFKQANYDAAAALDARAEAEKRASERQGRADSVRQYFESPLMRIKREAAEIRDLQQGGELSNDDARRSLTELNKEYEELARQQFEASEAGQLFGGVLKGQIRNVGEFKAALAALIQQRLMEKLFGLIGKLGDLFGVLAGDGPSTGGSSGILKSIGKVASSLFGGGRATGGPVVPGMFYRVNENTPRSEWFAPSMPGTIVTAAQAEKVFADRAAGGGAAPVFNMTTHIDARGADQSAIPAIKSALAQQQADFQAWAQGEKERVWGHMANGRRRIDSLNG